MAVAFPARSSAMLLRQSSSDSTKGFRCRVQLEAEKKTRTDLVRQDIEVKKDETKKRSEISHGFFKINDSRMINGSLPEDKSYFKSLRSPSPLLSMSDTHSHPLVPGLRGCKALMVVSRSWPHLGRACMSALARMPTSQVMPLTPDRLGTTCSVLSQPGRKTVGRSSRCSRSCIQVALSRKQEVIEKRQECKEVVEC